MCFLVHGVCCPDAVADGKRLDDVVADSALGVVEFEYELKSDIVRSLKIGRSCRFFPGCCARSASVACFIKVDEESERWSISSDKLRLLSIGFFEPNELLLEIWLVGGVDRASCGRKFPVCKGP